MKNYTQILFGLMSCILLPTGLSAQLGTYSFSGIGSCPHQNTSVNAQPVNSVFSSFSSANMTCVVATDIYKTNALNTGNGISTNEYHQFTITPNTGYLLTLTSIDFTESTNEIAGGSGTTWALRSS